MFLYKIYFKNQQIPWLTVQMEQPVLKYNATNFMMEKQKWNSQDVEGSQAHSCPHFFIKYVAMLTEITKKEYITSGYKVTNNIIKNNVFLSNVDGKRRQGETSIIEPIPSFRPGNQQTLSRANTFMNRHKIILFTCWEIGGGGRGKRTKIVLKKKVCRH